MPRKTVSSLSERVMFQKVINALAQKQEQRIQKGSGWVGGQRSSQVACAGLEPGRGHFRTYRYPAKAKPKLV